MKCSVLGLLKMKRRAEAVMEIQSRISHELNQEKIGKTLRVLFDGKEGGHFIGRTAADSPEVDNEVLVPTDGNYLRIGDFANIRITGAGHYELFGLPASQEPGKDV